MNRPEAAAAFSDHCSRVEEETEREVARGRGSERGRPGLHSERARDVEMLAGHACHAVARL
jgi:hypothetical protein